MTDTRARITAAAAIVGIDAEILGDHLTEVAEALRSPVLSTNPTVDAIGLAVDLPDDQWLARRMGNLASGVSGSPALARAAIARRGARRVERALGGLDSFGMMNMFATLAITGTATLSQDLAAAAAIGLSPGACESLAGRLRSLAGDDAPGTRRVIRTIVYPGLAGRDTTVELGTEARPDLLDVLPAVAEAFTVTADQLVFLRAVHPALVESGQPWVRIPATPTAIKPGFTLAYGEQPLDNAFAIAGKLGDLRRFEAFVRASGARSVASLDLVFGPSELGTAWLGVTV